ncbi:hypothetical protein [Pedobacter sp. Leaf194]|uniref:hypothetical protein n=1 Tax=Pedobacter sp. Leaf194 TaxID=1736297 RepID=UPI000B32BBF7|nr:hypothetical protein [Pedobacter sp. Leaf194]
MMKRYLTTLMLLLSLSVTMISCKKNGIENLSKDALTGTWQEVSTGYNRVLIFEPGNKITILIKMSQFADWSLKLTGKYVADGDNLTAKLTEQTEKQASGSVTTPVNYTWFDKGKFNIKNFVLTVNYKTYPADAPVDTETKFNKIVAID